MRSPCKQSLWPTCSRRGQSQSTSVMWMMMTGSKSEDTVAMAIKRKEPNWRSQSEEGVCITARLCRPSRMLTAQGETGLDGQWRGESGRSGRKMWVGEGARGVFIDLSASSADTAATGPHFCWQTQHLYTHSVLAPFCVHMCTLPVAFLLRDRGRYLQGSGLHCLPPEWRAGEVLNKLCCY